MVSGAVAERVKIVAYVQFSVLIIFLIYPLVSDAHASRARVQIEMRRVVVAIVW